jgi:mRNA-degrading endonuclease toxin of MazEF toxin-antitoxin module
MPLPIRFLASLSAIPICGAKTIKQAARRGLKDRPCAIVLSKKAAGEDMIVTVAAITHTEPEHPDMAVEIPLRVKQHLNLDSERSWIICTEVNRFIWPGAGFAAHTGP